MATRVKQGVSCRDTNLLVPLVYWFEWGIDFADVLDDNIDIIEALFILGPLMI